MKITLFTSNHRPIYSSFLSSSILISIASSIQSNRVSVRFPTAGVTAMIYAKELARYRNTNFEHPPGLQKFSSLQHNSNDNIVERILKSSRPCSNSIHGGEYLWETKSRTALRLFWLLIILAAIGACGVMYAELTARHRKQILNTFVETSQLPIYSINFPSVAVCPWNHVNWIRYKGAEDKFLPTNVGSTVKELFSALLSVLEGITFTSFDTIESLLNLTFPAVIDNIILYDLAHFMAFRCDELFVSCVFDETVYDCCKIFVTERTERGFCLVFNSLVSEESRIKKLTDAFYPWKIRTSGEGSGLTFTLRSNKTFQRPGSVTPFAFSLLIKESDEWSDSVYHYLLPNTHNYLSITPIITETSSNTRSMDPQKRRCLFPDENSETYGRVDGLPFNRLNCLVECQQSFVISHCNCTLSMFLPEMSGYRNRECKVADLPCLYQHRDVFNYVKSPNQDNYIKDSRRGMECDCIDSCLSMIFLVSANLNLLTNYSSSSPEVKADIYIGRNVMTKYGARLEYTSMDLVANFGGVLGLCLGASILSVTEIIYVLLKVIIVWLVTKCKIRHRRRKVHFVENSKVYQRK